MSRLSHLLIEKKWLCAVAESCTGGLISAALTHNPGSSQWFDCGFVTYSNASKHKILAVPESTLDTTGAVSELTVIAMAEGALLRSQAAITVAVSGFAGPEGGDPKTPVGTVWFAWAKTACPTQTSYHHIDGSRQDVRECCVDLALSGLIRLIG